MFARKHIVGGKRVRFDRLNRGWPKLLENHKTSSRLVLPSSSAYLPSLDDWAQNSGSSILISCRAQGGLVGVWLSFGDATGAIFACFLTAVGFFIDAAVSLERWVEEEDEFGACGVGLKNV